MGHGMDDCEETTIRDARRVAAHVDIERPRKGLRELMMKRRLCVRAGDVSKIQKSKAVTAS